MKVNFFSCKHLKECALGQDYDTLCVPLHKAKEAIDKFKDETCASDEDL